MTNCMLMTQKKFLSWQRCTKNVDLLYLVTTRVRLVRNRRAFKAERVDLCWPRRHTINDKIAQNRHKSFFKDYPKFDVGKYFVGFDVQVLVLYWKHEMCGWIPEHKSVVSASFQTGARALNLMNSVNKVENKQGVEWRSTYVRIASRTNARRKCQTYKKYKHRSSLHNSHEFGRLVRNSTSPYNNVNRLSKLQHRQNNVIGEKSSTKPVMPWRHVTRVSCENKTFVLVLQPARSSWRWTESEGCHSDVKFVFTNTGTCWSHDRHLLL